MKFERFLIFGWRFSYKKLTFLRGLDSLGEYYKLSFPGYRTYIRGWK